MKCIRKNWMLSSLGSESEVKYYLIKGKFMYIYFDLEFNLYFNSALVLVYATNRKTRRSTVTKEHL